MSIHFANFSATQTGILNASRAESMINNANQKARDWINDQDNIVIIDICSSYSNSVAVTSVWYKKDVPVLKAAQT